MRLPFFLARRFVAAETVDKTLPVAAGLRSRGLKTTLDLLGEYLDHRRKVEQARDAYLSLIDSIDAAGDRIDRNISIKLSMLGQKIDESYCLDNLHVLLDRARSRNTFVRLDMEGSDVTASTVSIFERVQSEYPDHVGIVLQAYLKRTREDVQRMCEMNARVRICKGAYKEPESIAWQDMPTIRERYLEYMEMLITKGRYPGIATHDDNLIEATKSFVRDNNIPNEDFEFQMLFGIRTDTQQAIADEGFNMRIYVPFGKMWVPYFSRRLRERKENVWFILKNMFRK